MHKTDYKLQSALEYLTTYGWVFLILGVVFAIIVGFGVFNPESFTGTECLLPNGFGCLSYVLTTGGVLTVNLEQATSSAISVTAIGCNANQSTKNMQAQSPQVDMPIGSNTFFSVPCYDQNNVQITSIVGRVYKGYLVVNYTDAQTNFPHVVFGRLIIKANAK